MTNPDVDRAIAGAGELQNAGRHGEAVAMLQRLAELHGGDARVWQALGIALAVGGQRAEAAAALAAGVRTDPDSPELCNNLGAVLLVSKRASEAVAPLRRAVELQPGYADAWRNLGAALSHLGQNPEALDALVQLVKLRPEDADAHYRLGGAAAAMNDLELAEREFVRAIALKPDYAAAISRLGNLRRRQGNLEQAIELFERARRIEPDSVETLTNLGEALLFGGRAREGEAPLSRAIALGAQHAPAYLNLGCVQMQLGKIDAAIESFHASLRIDPDAPRTHMNLGMALLQRGEMLRGWEECEWRFRLPDSRHGNNVYHRFPPWQGEALEGRTIFVHEEQGFGDTLQFARYLPLVAARGAGKVVVGCRPQLRRLFERIRGVDEVVETGQPVPPIDVQCPFMSLPLMFRTTLQTIPAQVPYLYPADAMVEAWKRRLGDVRGLKVGLCWAGNPTNPRDRYRSVSFDNLAPLADIGGVTFYSLQLGSSAQARERAKAPQLIDFTEELTDWMDTAALAANLDLVISVDTAVAHLAGALGLRTWTLLAAAGEWRWLVEREDSPWYPTMRLFRQPHAGDWASVIACVARELEAASHG